jgi:hypothetical protein
MLMTAVEMTAVEVTAVEAAEHVASTKVAAAPKMTATPKMTAAAATPASECGSRERGTAENDPGCHNNHLHRLTQFGLTRHDNLLCRYRLQSLP